ncbi:MAG: hypothetical protein ACYC0L_05905 [Thermoleophilia bacterium]
MISYQLGTSDFRQRMNDIKKHAAQLMEAAVIMNEANDEIEVFEIEAELKDPEINEALAESNKQIEMGEVGTEEELFETSRL